MAEQLDSLLQKIQDEAVSSAKTKSDKLVSSAKEKSAKIIADAEQKAAKIIAAAEKQSELFVENSKKAIDFAARDLLIYLRAAITSQFDALLKKSVTEIVTVEVIQEILIKYATQMRQDAGQSEKLELLVSEKDSKQLMDFFQSRFQKSFATGSVLKPMPSIKAGFKISLSEKNLQYDFSDEALVAMLSQLVNPALAEILQKTASK